MYQSFQSQQNGLFRLYRTFELTRSKKCPFILKQHCWICTSSSWRLSFFSSYSRISWTADSHHCPSEDMSFLLAILLTFSTKTSGLIFGKPLSKGQPSTRLFIGVGGNLTIVLYLSVLGTLLWVTLVLIAIIVQIQVLYVSTLIQFSFPLLQEVCDYGHYLLAGR